MAQVVRTTNQLIINSLMLIGELGIGETPDGYMLQTGLELINELLDAWSADSIYVPFLTTLDHQFIVGKDTYSISDMLLGTDITADRVVDLTFANYTVPGTGINQNSNPISQDFIADNTTNYITVGSTVAFPTGTPVTISTVGTVPSPLVAGVTYYTIFVSGTTLMLASSEQNALIGTPIDILTDGIPVNTITTYQGNLNVFETALVYPLRIINKATYWGVVRQTNLQARPGFIFLNKQADESFITVYPVPDQPYPFKLQVKSMINELTAQDTLGELPPFYYGFMKYALGQRWISYYPSGNWNPQSQQILDDYYSTLKNSNETDLTIRPSVTLTAPEPFYWPNILSY